MTSGAGIPAGGSTRAWADHFAAACDAVSEFIRGGDAVENLAASRPVVCAAPSFQSTIHAVLAAESAQAPTVPEADTRSASDRGHGRPARQRRGARRTPAGTAPTRPPSSDGKAGTDEAPPQGSRAKPTTSPTPPRAPDTTAVCQLPRRRAEGRLRLAAGMVPDRRPDRLAPLPTSEPSARRADPTMPPFATMLDRVVSGVAARLGVDGTGALTIATRAPVVSGPVVAADMLASLADRRRPAIAPEPGPTPARPAAREPAMKSSDIGRRSTAAAPGPTPDRARPPASADSSDEDRPGTHHESPTTERPAPSRASDSTMVRHVSTHHELPSIPGRDRSSTRSPFPPRSTDGAADADHSPVAVGDDGELERRMKQVLDEAARRHGIDV